jgi:transposase
MDGSKDQPHLTAGLDLGDKYSYLCLIDTQSGEVMEEGRLRTTPEAFLRRFASERPLRIAIEAGTHSPWASRLLEECGHEVLVANARKLRLIYAKNAKKRAAVAVARKLSVLLHSLWVSGEIYEPLRNATRSRVRAA